MININNYAQRSITFNGRTYLFVSDTIMNKLYNQYNECKTVQAEELSAQIFAFIDKKEFELTDLQLLEKSTILETELCAEFIIKDPNKLEDYFIYGSETINLDFDFIVNWAPHAEVSKGLDHLKIKAIENYFKNN